MKKLLYSRCFILLMILGVISLTVSSCKKEKSPVNNNISNIDPVIPDSTDNNTDTTNNNVNDSIYVKFSADNSHYAYYYPQDSIRTTYNVGASGDGYFSVDAFPWPNPSTEIYFSFFTNNIAVGSIHQLNDLLSTPDLPGLSYWVITPTNIHITELGATGGYFSGNFSGEVQSRDPPLYPMISISGSFRLRRTF